AISASAAITMAMIARPSSVSFFTTVDAGAVVPALLLDGKPVMSDAAVSVTTGAGRSGSGCPSTVSWIHDTSWPSSYDWTTGNFNESTSLGSGPTDTSNSSNSPGLIVPPDHTISDTASVSVPSSVVIGVASGAVVAW